LPKASLAEDLANRSNFHVDGSGTGTLIEPLGLIPGDVVAKHVHQKVFIEVWFDGLQLERVDFNRSR